MMEAIKEYSKDINNRKRQRETKRAKSWDGMMEAIKEYSKDINNRKTQGTWKMVGPMTRQR